MRKKIPLVLLITLSLTSFTGQALMMTCPDPHKTSLKDGIPPEPWHVNPLSPNPPTVDERTQFAKASILTAGERGLGVVCFYKNATGLYSIWWQVLVKLPAAQDYNWVETSGGFICTELIENCRFSVADR